MIYALSQIYTAFVQHGRGPEFSFLWLCTIDSTIMKPKNSNQKDAGKNKSLLKWTINANGPLVVIRVKAIVRIQSR